ncbi:hypothetical protein [Nostoc favosum]|uniref:Histidine kinase n=1 Tax=Nostoc favosum CHAB5714 TaxID=2780399 RepID=A0ABS8I577_9NOSO|nr:hypothetical protein [Nostoc favosum]MCC5599345.1 hypothetical protein [Nostoc favosum CHAB5714]
MRKNNQYPMPNAQRPMPNAQCPMPNAQCPMPHAPCPIPHSLKLCGLNSKKRSLVLIFLLIGLVLEP